MTKQRTRPGLAFTLMAAAAVLLALPATALAERGDRRHRSDADAEERHRVDERHEAHAGDRNGRHERERHASHRRHQAKHFSKHASWHDRRHFSRHDRRVSRHERYAREHRHARHASKHEHRPGYYCEPCGNRFGSRKGFYNHVHSAHNVPFWRLPRVVVSHGLGWIFFG